MSRLNEDFIFQVLSVVDEIPEGMVATYGIIAKLTGNDRNSRLVGRALSNSSNYGEYPCHRVVNANGRLVPGWHQQREVLLREKVSFNANGYVNLKNHLWNGDE